VHLLSLVETKIKGMVCVPFPTMIIDLKNPDFLNDWSSSTRYKVNRADKENFEIKRSNHLLADILNLFQKTARAKGLRGFTTGDFYSRPWILCTAIYQDNELLAGHVWIIDKEERRSLFYVNASDHRDEQTDASVIGRAHYYLLWKDGLYLQSIGIDTMDLYGYNPDESNPALTGVNTWKEGTHGRQQKLYNYYPVYVYWLRKFRNMVAG
jgi:lipid II:glycine glycyltransferase (peptidoglycan interpeptide bridge formation enzyme)